MGERRVRSESIPDAADCVDRIPGEPELRELLVGEWCEGVLLHGTLRWLRRLATVRVRRRQRSRLFWLGEQTEAVAIAYEAECPESMRGVDASPRFHAMEDHVFTEALEDRSVASDPQPEEAGRPFEAGHVQIGGGGVAGEPRWQLADALDDRIAFRGGRSRRPLAALGQEDASRHACILSRWLDPSRSDNLAVNWVNLQER